MNQVDHLSSQIQNTPVISNANIFDLGEEGYTLNFPLIITIEVCQDGGDDEDEEYFIAKWPELEQFAVGESESEAIKRLKLEILDIYDELNEEQRKLSNHLKSWKRTLNTLISKVG